MFECRQIPLGLFGPQDPSYFTESESDAVAWAKANATRFVEQVSIEVNVPGDVSTFAVRTFSYPDTDTGWKAWLDGEPQGSCTPDQLFARAAAAAVRS